MSATSWPGPWFMGASPAALGPRALPGAPSRRSGSGLVSMGTAGSVPRIAWVIHAGVDGATHGRSRPVSSIVARGLIYLGLDVHRDTISVAVLGPRRDAAEVDRIANDEPSVRRLMARFPDPRRLRACYEAGPTGYELARLLHSLGVRCEVIAPTLIPPRPGIGSRPTAATAGGWPGCTAPASWSPSVSRPWPRRRCGTCAAPARTCWPTGPGPGFAWVGFCCATAASGGVAPAPGPLPTSGGCWPSASTTPRWRRPTPTTGRPCRPATPPWTPSRPTWPPGTTSRHSLMRWPA
jgi:hypothetical protein